MGHIEESEQQRFAAWATWRRRLAGVHVWDEVWDSAPSLPEASAWHVAAVDAEGGRVTLTRRWSGTELMPPSGLAQDALRAAHPDGPCPHDETLVLDDPSVGKSSTFPRETAPLLAGDAGERTSNVRSESLNGGAT